MSDTKKLIKYVRDRLNDGPNITFGKPTVRDLVDAMEQAEASAEKAEADVARLTKALETQRNLTASANATAQAAWGGEIPSPFPGHKPSSEEDMVQLFEHLNCPLCGGSGHVDDCDHDSAEAIARLTKMVDWLAMHLSGYDARKKGTVYAADWVEAARRAVAAGEEPCQK